MYNVILNKENQKNLLINEENAIAQTNKYRL